jgi:hypothetical protein
VIPEIHDQLATSVAGALSAHKTATQPVGQRAGEIDAIPVTSNCQSCVFMGGRHGKCTVAAEATDICRYWTGDIDRMAERTKASGGFVIPLLYCHHRDPCVPKGN